MLVSYTCKLVRVSTCKLARVVFKWMVENVVFDVTLTENVKRFNNVIVISLIYVQ